MHEAAGTLTINLSALAENYKILQQRVAARCEVGGVLKANAYGLGASKVADALYAAGCRTFFVAKPEEALALQNLPTPRKIVILNGFYSSYADLYLQHNLTPVLGSFIEIESYKKRAAREGRKLPAFLKFNTRMNRLGLGAVETDKLLGDLSMLDGLSVECVMSHMACADEDHPLNDIQYELFNKIAAHFPYAQKSLANSAAIFRNDAYHFDLVRPGMALYGLNPTPDSANPMRPVVKVTVPVIRLRLVYKDATVGYGATYRFEKDSWLATLSAGYADGIFRTLGNRGKFYWKAYACPIRGRVSMDLTSVDLSAVPQSERPRPGDEMELLGPHQDADALAADAGTIGYEILTALGQRYKRVYTGIHS